MVRDAGSCCSSIEVRERALISGRGSFNINGCLWPNKGVRVRRSVTYFLVTELQCNSGQHDAT